MLELNKNFTTPDFTLLWVNEKECTKSESTKVMRFVWSTCSSCMKLYETVYICETNLYSVNIEEVVIQYLVIHNKPYTTVS